MNNIFYIIILICLIDLLEVKCNKYNDDELPKLNTHLIKNNLQKRNTRVYKKNIDNVNNYFDINKNIDDDSNIIKLEWLGNGDFGKKYLNNYPIDKSLWNGNKINLNHREIHFNHETNNEDNEESVQKEENIKENNDENVEYKELPLTPSPVLEPPFKFYSSSIHDLATENIEKFTTTESFNVWKNNNSPRIYEITSSNLSKIESKNVNKNDNENSLRSFIIDDPSGESKSLDSLRSVILNQQQNDNNNDYAKQLNDDKLINTNGNNNVIGANDVIKKYENKSFHWNRGNRKYQHAVDNDQISVGDKNWSYPTDDKYKWKKIRPINRNNNYRSFGTITRVNNLKSFERDNAENVAVPHDISRHDYFINQDRIHRRLQNKVRFLCPIDKKSHVYLADRSSHCRRFYVCYGGDISAPMMCPNDTLFNEELQVCDWWFNVTC